MMYLEYLLKSMKLSAVTTEFIFMAMNLCREIYLVVVIAILARVHVYYSLALANIKGLSNHFIPDTKGAT